MFDFAPGISGHVSGFVPCFPFPSRPKCVSLAVRPPQEAPCGIGLVRPYGSRQEQPDQSLKFRQGRDSLQPSRTDAVAFSGGNWVFVKFCCWHRVSLGSIDVCRFRPLIIHVPWLAEIKHQSCVVWQDILCPAPWVSGGNATNNTNGIVRLSSK